MINYAQIFISYLSLFLLGIAVLSAFRMLAFLKSRGASKSAIYSFNPLFILDYLKITKEETGNYGIWFKVCVISAILAAFFDIFHSLL